MEEKLKSEGEIRQILVTLARSYSGLVINVKVNPEVEEFVKGMGLGDFSDTRNFGRVWAPYPKTEEDLNVYNLSSDPGMMMCDDGTFFCLNIPGAPLSSMRQVPALGGASRSVLNMSFLRLVGIGQENGVSFLVKDIYTTEFLIDLRTKIGMASKTFYTRYMKPKTMSVLISSQDFR